MTNVQQPGPDEVRIPDSAAVPGTGMPQTGNPTGSEGGTLADRPTGSPTPTASTVGSSGIGATGATGSSTGGTWSGTASGSAGSGSTKDTAKEEAAHVAGTAKDAGRRVTETAKDEARHVASEAKAQGKRLLDQTMHEASSQAKTQQRRAAEGMHTFGSDLRDMASSSQRSGFAQQLIGEAGDRIDAAGRWLEDREPADLLDEVKRYARRHPGTFIAVAGVAGLVVGRLTSGMIGQAKDEHERAARAESYGATGAYGSTTPRHSSTTGTDWSGTSTTGTDWSRTGAAAGGMGATGAAATGAPTTGAVSPTDDPMLRARSSDASAIDDLSSDDELRRRAGL